MEIKLKEEEILKEPVVISVGELMKYKSVMRILVNFIHTAITKSMESVYLSEEMSHNLKNTILGVIKKFTQQNSLEKNIRCVVDAIRCDVDGRYIVTIKYIDGGTTSYSDDKVEFTIQKVSYV